MNDIRLKFRTAVRVTVPVTDGWPDAIACTQSAQTDFSGTVKQTGTPSAQVIISHVTDGLKLAEKNNLPKVIKDFISTHHGRGKTKFFYISWKNEHPGEEPNEEELRKIDELSLV